MKRTTASMTKLRDATVARVVLGAVIDERGNF
jgi:hypothetical protein